MTTLGSCIGYLLSTINWKNVGTSMINTRIQIQYTLTPEQSLFLLITVLFTISTVITLASAKEKYVKKYTAPRSIEENSSELTSNIEEKLMYGNQNAVVHDESINVIEKKYIFQGKYHKTCIRVYHPKLFKKCGHLGNFIINIILFLGYLISGLCKFDIRYLGIILPCSKNLLSMFVKKVRAVSLSDTIFMRYNI